MVSKMSFTTLVNAVLGERQAPKADKEGRRLLLNTVRGQTVTGTHICQILLTKKERGDGLCH